jgi:hypothetical protein
MKGWSYYTIPSIVFLSNLIAFQTIFGLKLEPRVCFFIYFLFNLYAFLIASLSGQNERFLKVFLPWVFLPIFVLLMRFQIDSTVLGLILIFIITVSLEWLEFKKINLWVDIFRLVVVSFVSWELKEWLRDFLVLSSVIASH